MEAQPQVGHDEPLVAHPMAAFVLDGLLVAAVAAVGTAMFGSLLWAGLGAVFCAATHAWCRTTDCCSGAADPAGRHREHQQTIVPTRVEPQVARAA